MSFGYLGDTSTKIKQVKKNDGVISVAEAYELEKLGHLGGSLQLIASTTVSSNTTIDFTSIKETEYNVHFLTYSNMTMTAAAGNQIPFYRLSNDGGSSFESGTDYLSTAQFSTTGGTHVKLALVNTYGHLCGNQQSSHFWDGYAYFYNLGDSAKYSYATIHARGVYSSDSTVSTTYGGSVYAVKETINAIRLGVDGTTLSGGTAKLYGMKQWVI